jgi:hypothetical protein
MLFKKFSGDIYIKLQPEYKTYQTENGKESLLISKNYTVVKQGKLGEIRIFVDLSYQSLVTEANLRYFIVGDGATSVVVKACRNKDINDSVAIKKVKRVFEHTAFAHRAMRELRLLRCLGSHENVSFSLKNANKI